MTDKEKIRAEIERRIEELQQCNTRENLRAHGAIAGYYQILSFIDSMQEEHCTETEFREIEILRTKLSDIAKAIYYHEGKENPTIERIREIVQDCCFELMDLKKPKQKEPVSEEWIEELRIKLHSMSKEDFKKVFDKYAVNFKEEPVSEIDFEQELYKDFGHVKDFTLCLKIARRFYEMGRNYQEPVSEELGEASKEWLKPQLDKSYADYGEAKMMELTHFDGYAMLDAIEYGMRLQKEQIEEALLSEVLPCFMHGGEADEVVAKLDEVLNQKK